MSLFKSRRAFTLVEVMIVVAILALMMAITIPALKQAHEKANHQGTNWQDVSSYKDEWGKDDEFKSAQK